MSLGIHVLADRVRSKDEMFKLVSDIQARVHVVVNDAGFAARTLLLPNKPTVIYRRWRNDTGPRGDDNAQNHVPAERFIEYIHTEAPPGAVLSLGNEPECQTPAQLEKIGLWTIVGLQRAEAVNRRCAVFNFPTWNPTADAWNHPIIRRALDMVEAGGHVVGLHAYWGVDGERNPWAGKNFPENMGRWQDLRRLRPNIAIVATETGYCHEFKPQVGWKGHLSEDEYLSWLIQVNNRWAEVGIDGCIFALGSETDDWGSFCVSPKIATALGGANQLHPPPETMPTPAPIPIPQPSPLPSPAAWYWHRPVRAPFVITSPFGERVMPEDWNKPPAQQRKETHFGTDYTAADWTAYAAREGTVVFAGADTTGFGNLVKLGHEGGYTSLYGHLESISVRLGDRVTAGQKVGVIGSTGRSKARHLHWQTQKDGVPYAPAPETRPHPSDAPTSPVPAPLPTPAPIPASDAMLGLLEAADDAWQRVLELRRQRDDLLAMLDAAVWDFEAKQQKVSEARNEQRRIA